jgi:hypothetical protein
MSNLVKVEGYSGLMKDPNTGAVVNTDKRSYLEHRAAMLSAKNRAKEQVCLKETVEDLQHDVISLKQDINEIKQLLINLVGKQ